LIDLRTNWNEIFPREKDEYELALEELGENSSEKKWPLLKYGWIIIFMPYIYL